MRQLPALYTSLYHFLNNIFLAATLLLPEVHTVTTEYQLTRPEEVFEPYWEEQEEIDFSNLFDLSGFEEHVDPDKLEELKLQKQLLEHFRFPSLDDLVPEEVKGTEGVRKNDANVWLYEWRESRRVSQCSIGKNQE